MDREELKNKANGLFEEAAKKTKEISNEAIEVSKTFADKAKKTLKAEKLDYQISVKYKEIGKLVYEAYEEEGSYDKVADTLCEEINALFDQIIAIKLGDDPDEESKEEVISEVNNAINEDITEE